MEPECPAFAAGVRWNRRYPKLSTCSETLGNDIFTHILFHRLWSAAQARCGKGDLSTTEIGGKPMKKRIFHPLAQVAAIMDPDRW